MSYLRRQSPGEVYVTDDQSKRWTIIILDRDGPHRVIIMMEDGEITSTPSHVSDWEHLIQ